LILDFSTSSATTAEFAFPGPGFYLIVLNAAARNVAGVNWGWDFTDLATSSVHTCVISPAGGIMFYDLFLDAGTGTTGDIATLNGIGVTVSSVRVNRFQSEVVAVQVTNPATDKLRINFDNTTAVQLAVQGSIGPFQCECGVSLVASELPPALTTILKKRGGVSVENQLLELRELVNKLVQKNEVSTSSGMLAAMGEQKKANVGENGKDGKSEPQSKPRSNSTDSLVLVDTAGNTAVSTPALATAVASASGVSPKQTYAAAVSKPKGDDRKKQVDPNTKKK